jgi:serine/threonine-protein phosphatase 2A regulatory subunit A
MDQANLRQIAKAVDEEVVNRDLVPAFVKLLKDTEAEVRSAIAGQIPGKHVATKYYKARLICCYQDSVLFSNARLFSTMSCLASRSWSPTSHSMFAQHSEPRLVGWPRFSERRSKLPATCDRVLANDSRTISHLLPMFLQMLKDEFPDVRLNIISKLESVNNGMSDQAFFPRP